MVLCYLLFASSLPYSFVDTPPDDGGAKYFTYHTPRHGSHPTGMHQGNQPHEQRGSESTSSSPHEPPYGSNHTLQYSHRRQGSDVSELEMAVNLGAPSEGSPYAAVEVDRKCAKVTPEKSPIGPSWIKVGGKGRSKKEKEKGKEKEKKAKKDKKVLSKSQSALCTLMKPEDKASPPARNPTHGSPKGSSQGSPRQTTLTRGRYVNVDVGMMYRARSNSNAQDYEASKNRQRLSSYGQQVNDFFRRDSGDASSQPSATLFSASLGFFGPDSGSRDGLNNYEEEML